MPEEYNNFRHRSWIAKFGDAFRGIKIGMRGQSSFFVHIFIAFLVAIAGLVLGVSRIEWCLLILCIAGVLTTEMVNSAIEILAKAVTNEYHEHIRDALHMGSAAVLLASFGSAAVGTIIFLYRLGLMLTWW